MPAVNDPLGAIKSYLFPMLLSGFTILVWNDIREIKQDVKALMAQSNIDKTRIDNLERILYKSSVLASPSAYKPPFPPSKHTQYLRCELVAVLPENKLNPTTDETFA